ILLPAPEADRVRSLIANLETAVEGRAAMRAAVLPTPDQQAAVRGAALLEGAAALEALDPVEAALAGQYAWADAAAVLRRLADEAQQDACGRTESVVRSEYPPCARPAGHSEAYCRSADGKTHFLALYGPRPATKPARGAQQDPIQGGEALPPSTAPLASGLPPVKGNCPACQHASLFLGTGGYPTCSNADCPEPDTATTVLEQYANEAHSPSHAWTVESPRRDNWASWGATYDDRDWASESYESAVSTAPQRPFRLVRATTTYTVEAEHTPAAVARSGQPETD
ncbi:hypothetical protein AB0E62_40085, partial [Streptomyces sp. NPDC038707]|uniref:hypothetical protein n=1 Tax=Streptomyces sp. NPDC038707 TaxID=3154329 RepID=UPI0033E80FB8